MSTNKGPSSKDFENKLDLLIKRFKEQKGIIDSYVKREREWGGETKINIDGNYDIVVDSFYQLKEFLNN